jgi:hypothetical protein
MKPNHQILPAEVCDSLKRYIELRIRPGHFLSAVLCNDLTQAVARADPTNLSQLPDYVKWLYNHAPGNSWGSRDRFEAWLRGDQSSALARK